MNTTVPFDRVIPPVPWIVGHRGAAGLAPENTLPGIRRGLACGVQGIEIDVHWAHEILWVLHDDTLSRTTNLQGRLDTLSVEQLNAADAGAGARIPRLTDVLAAVPGNSLLNIELKGQRTGAPVAHALEAEAPRALLVTSFRWEELDAYRAAGGSAPIGVLAPRLNDRVLRAARRLGAWSVNLGNRALTRTAVSRVAAAGYRTLVYTVNDLERARQLISWGVDGLFTDYPDRITHAALREPRAG